MVVRKRIRNGATPKADIQLRGVIKQRGISNYAPLTRQKICHVDVEVNDMTVTVAAYGELADMLAGLRSGTAIAVEGQLDIVRWDTGDGQMHQRMGAKAERIDAI